LPFAVPYPNIFSVIAGNNPRVFSNDRLNIGTILNTI
jgi:hypothetical protein